MLDRDISIMRQFKETVDINEMEEMEAKTKEELNICRRDFNI